MRGGEKMKWEEGKYEFYYLHVKCIKITVAYVDRKGYKYSYLNVSSKIIDTLEDCKKVAVSSLKYRLKEMLNMLNEGEVK